jgi:regulator of cell morphogenesis and NO signaling
MMQTQTPLTVSQMVQADYRLADVFKKWGINYCCGGSLTLDEVCRLQGLDKAKVETDMLHAQQNVLLPNAVSFADWPVDFLTDYIVHVHHAYIKTAAPRLLLSIETFAKSHQKKHPYITGIHEHLKKLVAALEEQMQQEETVLFPYFKQVCNAWKRRESYGPLFVRTLHKSLGETTGRTQQQTAALVTSLRQAARQYQPPEAACTAHQVLCHKLKEFDTDLVQHKHLEHNLLYPKVVQLEQELLQL